ncbi:DinB family protein [Priestia megaterium]|uniref:DinB family protein n=1 Tax=Priestia megaterium TaxID=1404 RepID=UPI002E1EEECC|nr:DinB family protein [Priestia megaterium]
MEGYIFKQLNFARENTIKLVSHMDDATTEIIPEKLNNNIKWNIGHIYVIQEKFAFSFAGERLNIPENYDRFFAPGTKPLEWSTEPPTLIELLDLLTVQNQRLELILSKRLEEKVLHPYTTSTGLKLTYIREFLSFCLYHEGMHFNAIKNIKFILS